jgi:hypothetical protein
LNLGCGYGVKPELTLRSQEGEITIEHPFAQSSPCLALIGKTVLSSQVDPKNGELHLSFDNVVVAHFSREAAPWECYCIGDGKLEWVF